MSFERTVLFAAVCDGCGPGWWEGETDAGPLFATRAAARRELTADYAWRLDRQIDGTVRMFCAACADKQDCDRYGHDWQRMSADDVRRVDPALFHCVRCTLIRRDDEPPSGHPDSMSAVLDGDDEELLAELDAATWPDEAEDGDLAATIDRLKNG